MDEIESLAEKLRIYEEKEKRRLESINKSKQRPGYKEKVKEYNKMYYRKRKESNDKSNKIT
jgi:hypothetical protein